MVVIRLRCSLPAYHSKPSLICDFCPSDQRFAYSFLQIPPHSRHPCCSAIHFPLPGHVRDLHPLERAHGAQTKKKSPYELWVFGGLGESAYLSNRATITLHHRILPDQILIYILFSSNQVLSCKYVWLHHKSIQKLGNSTMLPILVWWCLESNQILLLTMLYL